MPVTTNFQIPLPEQSTSPPDVVKWLTDGMNVVDSSIASVDQRIQAGLVANLPATLPIGVLWCGY